MSRSGGTRRVPYDDEGGFAGGAEGLLFGLLLFVVGTLLAGNAWAVVDTKLAVDAASREGARSYVEAPDAAAASAAATSAASETLTGYGRDPTRAQVQINGTAFGRCTRVTVALTYRAPLVALPLIGERGSAETVRAQHSELVDPYRSGLPGASVCG